VLPLHGSARAGTGPPWTSATAWGTRSRGWPASRCSASEPTSRIRTWSWSSG